MATVFSGGTYSNATFTGAVRSDIQKNVAAQLVAAGWSSLSGATGSGTGPGNAGTVTITIASPAVVSFSAHGFLGGERVILQTTGALPTGLSVNTVYFVKFIDASTFNLALTLGGANINTSGSQSGVHTLNAESYLLESATQGNVSNPIRVRLKDNRGSCIQVSIENHAGTLAGGNSTSAGGNLLPAAAKTFQVLASQYRFEVFTTGTSAAREFVAAGMLNVPANVTGIVDHGYMMSNSYTDVATGIGSSVQTKLVLATNNAVANNQLIWNSNLIESANQINNGTGTGWPELLLPNGAAARGLRWANDKISGADVLVSAGVTASSDEGKIKGQVYDWIFVGKQRAKDVTDTFSGHDWQNLSDNLATGGIWVATD